MSQHAENTEIKIIKNCVTNLMIVTPKEKVLTLSKKQNPKK